MSMRQKCPVAGCGTIIEVGGDVLEPTTAQTLAERMKTHVSIYHPKVLSLEEIKNYEAMLVFSRDAFRALALRGAGAAITEEDTRIFAEASLRITALVGEPLVRT